MVQSKKRRPVGYLLQQRGYSEYSGFFRSKRAALLEAEYCRWLGKPSTVTPLFAGKPVTVRP
jgi:hypothetical protein